MITSHHSFSSRIFLDARSPAPKAPAAPAAEQAENLREFWWFLRSAHPQSREVISAQRQARGHKASAANPGSAKHA